VKKYFFFLLICVSTFTNAQNTIGGVKTTVPESEVKKQSAFLEAEKERLLGHWDKAVEAYKTFLFDNPDVDAAWYGLSRTYTAQKDMVNAFDAISKAVALSPDNQWYLLYQAELYENNGRNRDAVETYETLIKRFPQTPEFYQKLAYLAVLNEDPKRGLKALDKLEKIIGIHQDNIAKKHLIYVGLGDNKRAAEEYLKLADAYPSNEKYRYQLADFYERIGDQKNAIKTWEDIARRFPGDPIAKLALAQQPGGTDIQYLNSIRPVFADPKVSIDSKIKELMPFLSKIEGGKDPALAENLLALGALLEQAHPDDPKAWSVSGDLLYLNNQNTEALEKYRQCLKLNPGVFSVWDNMLNILRLQKNYAETEKEAEKALDYFPNQPKAYLHYAAAAIAMRHFDAAIPPLNQAQIMAGKDALLLAEIFELQGDAQLGKGDKNKAKDLWLKAFDISKNPAIQEKINRLQ
jgi:tetratricopeptide (TPR) repeat protein